MFSSVVTHHVVNMTDIKKNIVNNCKNNQNKGNFEVINEMQGSQH